MTRVLPVLVLSFVPIFTKDEKTWNSAVALIDNFSWQISAFFLAIAIARVTRSRNEALQKISELAATLQDERDSQKEVIAKQVAELSELSTASAIARTTQMLAHDVRKPFSMLKMTLDLLNKARTPDEMKKILKVATTDVQRAMVSVDGLVQDVMEIGSKSEISPEPVQADTLVHAALADTFRIHNKADVALEVSFGHSHELSIDTNKAMRIFLNIIGNAVQAMNQNGKLWIRTSDATNAQGETFAHFVVGNNGPVIPSEDLSNLFDAFFTKNKKGGTGLGLAIARKVVHAHKGTIYCKSSQEIGVEFHFTLPTNAQPFKLSHQFPCNSREMVTLIEPAYSKPLDENMLEATAVEKLRAVGRSMRVLIVDDEALYRNAVMEHLKENEEILSLLNIGLAKNSSEANAAVRSAGGTDLAIFDVDLGAASANGFQLLSELRNDGFSALACIHTNRVLLGDNKKAMECGADVFLPKPMSRSHLLKLVIQAAEKISAEKTADTHAQTAAVQEIIVALLDDDPLVQMAWEMEFTGGKLLCFNSPEQFFERAAADSSFLSSLCCVVTDFYFDTSSQFNGVTFAEKLKTISPITKVLLSTNASKASLDVSPAVHKVIPKEPITSAEALLEILKKP